MPDPSDLSTVSTVSSTSLPSPAPGEESVLRCGEISAAAVDALFGRFGLTVRRVGPGEAIPGSFWGEPEAGIVGSTLWLRPDTPVHSALHEGCHLICADAERRRGIDTDAGGSDQEENGVCYLQILLAEHLPGAGAARLMDDMDAWGYSFRLGSARAWFEADAEDARAWLLEHGLVREVEGAPGGVEPTWTARR